MICGAQSISYNGLRRQAFCPTEHSVASSGAAGVSWPVGIGGVSKGYPTMRMQFRLLSRARRSPDWVSLATSVLGKLSGPCSFNPSRVFSDVTSDDDHSLSLGGVME